jgi:hypothetical protein
MLTIAIEPVVFAPPVGDATADSVREYVVALLHWKQVLDGKFARILACRATSEVLITCKRYPFRPRLRELLRITNVIDYDFNTIAVLADTLVGQAGDFEGAMGVSDLLTSEDTQITPDVFEGVTPDILRAESEKCLVVLAILRTVSRDRSAVSYALALKSEPRSPVVSVDARIDIIDHCRGDLEGLPLAPARFGGTAMVCHSFQSYLLALDELKLWKCAADNRDLEVAIRVAIYKSREARGTGASWTGIPHFRINPRFHETVAMCGAFAADGLGRSALRSIVEAIDDLQMASVHSLNTGPGAEDPQQKRGTDLAWRRDITYEHHLHYWQCANGLKELSCMVTHDCFDIHR